MLDFLTALRGLTVRGRCFLAAGGACCGSSVAVGERDLFRVGLLLIALPLFAAAFISRTRYRLACARRLVPARATVGDSVSVNIRVDNMSRRSSSVLLVDDDIPDRLGYRARFVLEPVEAGDARHLSYELRTQMRGRYLIGPMSIRLTDPFGLCEVSRSFRSRDELVVVPNVEALPQSRPGGRVSISNHGSRNASAAGGDDLSTRPYQAGDDLRRVHWRTSARTGGLMVRREDSDRVGTATLLLDTRADAWADTGQRAGWIDGDHRSAFEWAVGAAASIAVHLTGIGQKVRLLHEYGSGVGTGTAATGNPTVPLDELAVVRAAARTPLRAVLGRVQPADSGMLVVILGRTDPIDAMALARTRPHGRSALALLVDVATWNADRSPGQDRDLEACRTAFQRHGWKVITAGHGDKLATLWLHPSGQGPGTPGATVTAAPGGAPVHQDAPARANPPAGTDQDQDQDQDHRSTPDAMSGGSGVGTPSDNPDPTRPDPTREATPEPVSVTEAGAVR